MKKVIKLLLFLLISAINFNIIIKPSKIVCGGAAGLSLIISDVLSINVATIILIINIITFIMSFIYLSKDTTRSIIISSFIYPLFVQITSFIDGIIIYNYIITIIISGIISGISIGNILKLNYSPGGLNVLVLIIKKYWGIKVHITNCIMNFIIVILGSYIFGVEKALYAIIVILINSYIIRLISEM